MVYETAHFQTDAHSIKFLPSCLQHFSSSRIRASPEFRVYSLVQVQFSVVDESDRQLSCLSDQSERREIMVFKSLIVWTNKLPVFRKKFAAHLDKLDFRHT